jgi:hypothetical protein
MKRILFLIICALLLGPIVYIHAESTTKELKEQTKESKKELNAKASKLARKEAKRLAKEGWTVVPGALPLEKQLDKSYLMQYQLNDEGLAEYIMAEAMSVGGNYDAAKMQSLELAKQNLAGQIQTEVTALIENTVANEQLGKGDAASITRSVMASKNLISQRIGRVVPVVETYRNTDNGNKEVLVRIAYSMDMAKAITKNAVKEELSERGDSLHNKLDQLLGW